MLSAHGLRLAFSGVKALQGADIDVAGGSITALIGPNRAGKTTAFNCIGRIQHVDGGTIERVLPPPGLPTQPQIEERTS